MKSSLVFDPSNASGLPKSIEAFLQQAGWTFVEAESGTRSYQSRWQVTVVGCSTQTGLVTIAPSDDSSQNIVQVRIVAF